MDRHRNLTFKERILAVAIYTGLLFAAIWIAGGDFHQILDQASPFSKIFLSGGLLLIFGAYISESLFTKPTDVLVNATGIVLFLLGIDSQDDFFLKQILLISAFLLLAGALVTIFLQKVDRFERGVQATIRIVVLFGQSRVAYSAIYLATLVTYFGDAKLAQVSLFSFWAIFVSGFVVEELIAGLGNTWTRFREDVEHLGVVMGIENQRVVRVRQRPNAQGGRLGDLVRVGSAGNASFGVVVEIFQDLAQKEILVYLFLQDRERDLGIGYLPETPAGKVVSKVALETLSDDMREKIISHPFFRQKDRFAGYVFPGSNIEKLKFRVFRDNETLRVSEGVIVEAMYSSQKVLYQVINGETRLEDISSDAKESFVVAVAQKLGIYDSEHSEIITAKWVPDVFTPVFLLHDARAPETKTDIGELPGTDYAIRIRDYDALVTHNTAILGILGVGKSCLTFELVQKVVENTASKVIVIDVTGQYADPKEGLPCYMSDVLIEKGIVGDINKSLPPLGDLEAMDAREDGGNIPQLREALETCLGAFAKSKKRVLIINPEEINAIQQTEHARNRGIKGRPGQWEMYAPFASLSVAEITRHISESVLDIAKKSGMSKDAKLLLVYEEAHSLIPEWNSAANDGDKAAANGTARVILQGRKYGLGSFVVTQRTANISKSILNQCNTIFALRVYDDTGKQFLENYIGQDFAATLPMLEDRHAVIVGKALKLKQPVIAKLNDRSAVTLPRPE